VLLLSKVRIRLSSPFLWAGLLLAVLLSVGSFYNLANYPTIWWDEAIFSETAANLVQHGRYAFTVQSPDQLTDLDFRISVGPAVILPVALAYHFFGVGVIPGRVVAGAYLILTFVALFLGARRLWGPAVALGAVALALGGTDVLYWGRSVLGDTPALALFLCATWLLIRAVEDGALLSLFLGGLLLGLAFDAKEFYGVSFLPPLVLLAQQGWRQKSRLGLRVLVYSAGLALPLLAYLVLKVFILGDLGAAVLHFYHQKKLLCHEFFTPLTIGRLYPESIIYLLGHPLFWLGILGVGWIWRKETFSPGEKLWVWNFFIWSLIYLTAVYWHRFALPSLFLASPLAALFIRQGIARLQSYGTNPPRWLPVAMILALLVAYPLPATDYLRQILTQQNDSPSCLVNYLRKNVPLRCLIETPEYELAFLDDDHRIHLMPPHFFVESTPERIVLLNPQLQPYDFDRVGAELLILGTFGKGVFKQVYSPARLARGWQRIAQVDNYDIYKRRDPAVKPLEVTPAPSPKRVKLVSRRAPNVPKPPPDPHYH
jgi:hypothetical protein